jgi:hypothetical protein
MSHIQHLAANIGIIAPDIFTMQQRNIYLKIFSFKKSYLLNIGVQCCQCNKTCT